MPGIVYVILIQLTAALTAWRAWRFVKSAYSDAGAAASMFFCGSMTVIIMIQYGSSLIGRYLLAAATYR